MLSCLAMGKKGKAESPFMKNGRVLLEKLIASCDGKTNPIRIFSEKDLSIATNNYRSDRRILQDVDYTLYKGFLQDRLISVKKYEGSALHELVITDLVFGSQMSVHKSVLKLIGCCLETTFPVLVYGFVGYKTLSYYLFADSGKRLEPLSWKCRTKIAANVANAVAYLHTALSRPVINGDIRLSTILLDEDFVPKLIDFSLAISIPEGESHVITEVRGRTGNIAPEYVSSGYLTDKVDVYSFGMLLFQLLSGQKKMYVVGGSLSLYVPGRDIVENQNLIGIVDPTILNDTDQQELLAFGRLALSCTRSHAEERPTMTDVGRELEGIFHSISTL